MPVQNSVTVSEPVDPSRVEELQGGLWFAVHVDIRVPAPRLLTSRADETPVRHEVGVLVVDPWLLINPDVVDGFIASVANNDVGPGSDHRAGCIESLWHFLQPAGHPPGLTPLAFVGVGSPVLHLAEQQHQGERKRCGGAEGAQPFGTVPVS